MDKTINKTALFFIWGIGFLLVPFWIRKPPLKDWTIIFLLAGFLSGMLDLFVTANRRVTYSISLIGKKIDISLLFDYLLFPTLGVFYNQATFRSKIKGILWKALCFSIPMTATEYWLEKYTKLVNWKNWSWYYTFASVTVVLWFERGFIAGIRKLSGR
jgi:hypothetical protein